MSEQGAKEKKAWGKPEMIVLVRNKPEEAVLSYCKGGGGEGSTGGSSGSSASDNGCLVTPCTPGCMVCNAS